MSKIFLELRYCYTHKQMNLLSCQTYTILWYQMIFLRRNYNERPIKYYATLATHKKVQYPGFDLVLKLLTLKLVKMIQDWKIARCWERLIFLDMCSKGVFFLLLIVIRRILSKRKKVPSISQLFSLREIRAGKVKNFNIH